MDHPRSGQQPVHVRWLPETAADRRLIEGMFHPAARQARVGVGEASGGAKVERIPGRRPDQRSTHTSQAT